MHCIQYIIKYMIDLLITDGFTVVLHCDKILYPSIKVNSMLFTSVQFIAALFIKNFIYKRKYDLFYAVSVRESCSPGASESLPASRRSSCKEAVLPSSPTLPEQRRKAWDEEVSSRGRGVAEIKQRRKEQPEETNEEGNINGHSADNKEE